jgi:hypothetical protein
MATIIQHWNFMRFLRLGMGLWLVYSAFADRQPLLGILGGLFALQAIMNAGCCGASGCTMPNARQSFDQTTKEPIQYEEVK